MELPTFRLQHWKEQIAELFPPATFLLERDRGHPYMKRDQVWNQSNDKQSGTWHRPWWHISTVTLQVGIPGWFLWPSLWTQPRVRGWRVWKIKTCKSLWCSHVQIHVLSASFKLLWGGHQYAVLCFTMLHKLLSSLFKKAVTNFRAFSVDFSILGRWNSQSTKSTNRSSSETKGYPGYMFDIGVSHIKWFKKC